MRIVFTEIYYEIRFFYYFLSLLGFKVFYFKLAFLKNVENLIYLKSINELKAKNINYVDLIESQMRPLILSISTMILKVQQLI